MVAFNFMARFADDVEAGRKGQTIRAERKDRRVPAKVGGMVQLYTGMRSPACRLLREEKCISIEPIIIDYDGTITVAGKVMFKGMDLKKLALADGFKTPEDMLRFFLGTHNVTKENPFRGWLIKWEVNK